MMKIRLRNEYDAWVASLVQPNGRFIMTLFGAQDITQEMCLEQARAMAPGLDFYVDEDPTE